MHTGVRLKIEIPGAGPILLADSDWMHMAAQARMLDCREIDVDQLLAGAPTEAWHQIAFLTGGPLVVSVQPVMLPDSYPDDEDQADDDQADDGRPHWARGRCWCDDFHRDQPTTLPLAPYGTGAP